MNILIGTVGRRVELVKCFKSALKTFGGGSVFGTDASDTSQAGYFCDKLIKVPPISDACYIDKLIEICKENKVGLYVPTIDTELLLLSKNKKRFLEEANCFVHISDYRVVDICRNKINTQKFFEDNGFKAPKLIDPDAVDVDTLKFPIFIKPSDGSSSINVFKVYNKKEFLFFKDYVKNPTIQEAVVGTEYTIDAFCDFESNPLAIVPRRRIAVRSGEILKGEIAKDRELIDETISVLKKLKSIGLVTIQCIRNDDGIFFLEINPRFGGGAPMSIYAGANFPLMLIELLNGKKLAYSEDYKDKITVLRFDESIVLDSNMKPLG